VLNCGIVELYNVKLHSEKYVLGAAPSPRLAARIRMRAHGPIVLDYAHNVRWRCGKEDSAHHDSRRFLRLTLMHDD
jgi:hypothetical protein